MGSLLHAIQAPNDVKKLTEAQLPALCEEIREQIINTVADNGGHLASNLGVVELTVALHRVFTLPEDSIIWDVGHQSYAHKLLTGRTDRFSTLRRENGLSGFPSRSESDCDPFTTGHSSASISSALGISAAKAIGKEPGNVVAVIGDGALSGGLAYEGLNNAGRLRRNLIVILNENTMSISKNVGSMARHLSQLRAKPGYLSAKDNIEKFLSRI
ncbi:MAG: 1-deoxy-D-xylulose-5-phosphate synthase, partial [Clostridia bacterium]|nr:1-deoxy-D-xylulose-5-phosphate synthase [Clostridia bacterium]